MASYLFQTLSVPVVASEGQSVSLADILNREFGARANSLTDIYISHFGTGALAYDPPLSFWTATPQTYPSTTAGTMATWLHNGAAIGPTPFDQLLSDYNPRVRVNSPNVVHVTQSTIADYSFKAGSNIAPFAFLTIPIARDADGTVTEYMQYSLIVVDPAVAGPTVTAGAPTAADIVASAQTYAAHYTDVANENDCCFIAQDIAAAAGASLDDNTQSLIPDDNLSAGFWRVVYRGSDPNAVAHWSSLVQPGDIVRFGWKQSFGGGAHTTTVISKAATPNANGTYTLQVFDNKAYDADGNEIIGIHADNDDGSTYDFRTQQDTVTIYRISPDHLYLIQGSAIGETLTGNQYNDQIEGGAGNDLLQGGSGDDVLNGGSGNDRISGGGGSNTIDGGTGSDTLIYGAAASSFTMSHDASGAWVISNGAFTDTIRNVEHIRFADTTMTLKSAVSFDMDDNWQGDMLWRDAGGTLAGYAMNGSTVTSSVNLGSPNSDWQMVGTGDFDGDGQSDVLWRDKWGDVGSWQLNNNAIGTAGIMGAPNPSWHLVGIGDLDGDGKSDIIWRRDDGWVGAWFMDGQKIVSGAMIGAPDSSWHFAGTGDFNADGDSDILWRRDDGWVGTWFMQGAQISGTAMIGAPSNDWKIIDTGDFNGDAHSDILWRNTDGTVATWMMNGAAIGDGETIGALDNSWTIAAVNDLNGDGRSDLVLQSDDGSVVSWLLNGAQIAGSPTLATPGASWQIQSHHFDLV